MNIVYPNLGAYLKDMYGQNGLIIRPQKQPNLNKIVDFDRDLDGQPNIHIIGTQHKYVDSTPIDEPLYKMSFENNNSTDIYDEYDNEEENIYSLLDNEDKLHIQEHLKHQRIGTKFYPDTDFSKDDNLNLNAMHINTILPTITASYNRDYGLLGAKAMQDGMTEREVFRKIAESNLNRPGSSKGKASIELFEFLLKNPNDRNVVVVKDKYEREHTDNTAIAYYPKLVSSFESKEIARNILDNCKINDENDLPMADSKLCNLAIELKEYSRNKDYSNNDLIIEILNKVNNENLDDYILTARSTMYSNDTTLLGLYRTLDNLYPAKDN